MTNSLSFNQKLTTVLLTVAAIWAVWQLHEVILLFFLSVIIAIGISLPARKFQSWGMKYIPSLVTSIILVSAVFLGVILWLVPLLANEIQAFVLAIPELLETLRVQYAGTGLGEILNSLLGTDSVTTFASSQDLSQLLGGFIDNGLPIVFSGAGILVSIVTNLFLVLVVAIMLLIEPKAYVRALLYVVPQSAHEPVVTVANKIYDTIKAWLSSLSFSILFTSLAVFIGMSIVGVANPAAIAMFAAVATFIPNIGAIIPIIPIALFTVGESIELFIIAVLVYLGIQLIESNIFTPAVVKNQLDIPVAAILVFQIIAGVLFGLLGLLLAVPLLAVLIVIVKELVAKHHYGYTESDIKLRADQKNHLRLG